MRPNARPSSTRPTTALTESSGLRFTAHYRNRRASCDRDAWTQMLPEWQCRLSPDLSDCGDDAVHGSLYVAGQVIVRLRRLEDILMTLEDRRVDATPQHERTLIDGGHAGKSSRLSQRWALTKETLSSRTCRTGPSE